MHTHTQTHRHVLLLDCQVCHMSPLPTCSVPLLQFRQRYGDVFSLQMAWKPVVVINGLKAVREVLVNCGEDTADRPPVPIFNHVGFGHNSQGKEL